MGQRKIVDAGHYAWFAAILAASLLLCLPAAAEGAPGATVTNTNDSGPGSLRAAIEGANAAAGGFAITFDPALTGQTIALATNLPVLTGGGISIDGDTNGDGKPDIMLDGQGVCEYAIATSSAGNTISHLAMASFTGIMAQIGRGPGGNNTLQGCYIGTDLSGRASAPCSYAYSAVRLWDDGGHDTVCENVVSSNANGIDAVEGAHDDTIRGNYVGTNGYGDPLNIAYSGIVAYDGAHDILIENNVIANCSLGILASTAGAAPAPTGVTVRSNHINHSGQWPAVYFNPGNGSVTGNTIDVVVGGGNGRAVWVGGADSSVTVDNNTITGGGIYIGAQAQSPSISGNVLSNEKNEAYAIIVDHAAGPSDIAGNTVTDFTAAFVSYTSQQVTFRNNTVHCPWEPGWPCVGVQEGSDLAVVENNYIEGYGSGTIEVNRSADVTVAGNTIRTPAGGSNGIALQFGATALSITGNTIVGPMNDGILLYGLGTTAARIDGNHITECSNVGVMIYGARAEAVTGNTLDNMEWGGISCLDAAVGSVTGNTIEASESGIQISNQNPPADYWTHVADRIDGNTVSLRGGTAINVGSVNLPFQIGSISGNTVTGGSYGIYATNAQVADICGNTVLGNPDTGVWAAQLNYVDATNICNNSLTNASRGIQLFAGHAGTISGNTITGGDWPGAGIYVYTGATGGSITGNHISHTFYGIGVDDGASADSVSGNALTDCWGPSVITCAAASVGEIKGNAVTRASGKGIDINPQPNVNAGIRRTPVVGSVSNNTITGTTGDGIRISQASPQIEGNHVTGSGAAGIALDTVDGEVSGCDVEANNVGIRVQNCAALAIHGCTIAGNAVYGVQNVSDQTVDARRNYWGSDTGPTDTNPPNSLADGIGPNPGGQGDTVTDYVQYGPWTVPNQPPVANAGPAQTVEQASAAGTQVTLDGSASSDPDNDPLTYTWTGPFPEGAGTVTGVQPTVTLPLGEHTITLVVNDGKVDSQPATVVITVRDTTPPVLHAPAAVTAEQTNHAGTPVDIGLATVVDVCDANPTVTNDAPAVFPLGTTVVTWTATDASGRKATAVQTVTVVDTTPPTLDVPDNVTVQQTNRDGTPVELGQPTVSDICDTNPTITNDAPATFPLGCTTVTWTATDASGKVSSDYQVVMVVDTTAPTITAPADTTVNEGDAAALGEPQVSDICDTSPIVTNDASAAIADGPAVVTVTWTAKDASGNSATATQTVTVNNLAPAVGAISAPVDPSPVGAEVQASADFTDPGTLDTHTATWGWGDGNTSAGAVDEANGSGTAGGSHTYTTPGIYTVTLTVIDKDGGRDDATFQYVVAYDPEGGFVTGGGWIQSPAGAYASDPSLTGKANFGFSAKYKKGANVPDGQTQFNFSVAGLSFHSSSYQWLVVAGAKAQFKGSGTINGAGDYGFLLTAIDGQINGGGGTDRFRIKIWDQGASGVIYDNRMDAVEDGADATALGGGSIVIHDK